MKSNLPFLFISHVQLVGDGHIKGIIIRLGYHKKFPSMMAFALSTTTTTITKQLISWQEFTLC